MLDCPLAGGRSRVVLARPRSADLVILVGVRCEVERSSAGVAAEGGVGAGRYEVGATEAVKVDGWDACFLGGGGGDRWMWRRYMKKVNERGRLLDFGSSLQF